MNKVLVLDDDPLVLKMLNKALTLLGYVPYTAPTPESALELLDTLSFDAVLAEVFLVSGNGLSVLQQIKGTQPRTCVIALIGSTGTAEKRASLEEIRQHGADFVLQKPVEMSQLERCLAAIPPPDALIP